MKIGNAKDAIGETFDVKYASDDVEDFGKIATKEIRIIGHRGASAEAPENSLKAFEIAGQQGYWGAECDIQKTSDNEFIIMHDSTVDRTTTGTGTTTDLTLAQILALEINYGSNIDTYSGQTVPTLNEFLNVCELYGMVPVLEMKSTLELSDMALILAILQSRGLEDTAIIISSATSYLEEMRSLSSGIKIQYVTTISEANIDYCETEEFDIDVQYLAVTTALVTYAHDRDIEVNVWGTSDVDLLQATREANVDYFSIDSLSYAYNTVTTPYETFGGIDIYNDYEKNKLINGKSIFDGTLETWLPRGYTETTFPNSYIPEYTRGVCFTKIILRENSSMTYTVPVGYYFMVRPYDGTGTPLTNPGWSLAGETTISTQPSGTTFGIGMIARVDGGVMTDVDYDAMNNMAITVDY